MAYLPATLGFFMAQFFTRAAFMIDDRTYVIDEMLSCFWALCPGCGLCIITMLLVPLNSASLRRKTSQIKCYLLESLSIAGSRAEILTLQTLLTDSAKLLPHTTGVSGGPGCQKDIFV